MDKIKIIPFAGDKEVAPDESFIYSKNSEGRMLKKLLEKYPNATTFEVWSEDEATHIADYNVTEGKLEPVKDGKRTEPEKPKEATKSAKTSISDLLAPTDGTPAHKADDFSENDGPETNRRIVDDDLVDAAATQPAPTGDHPRGLASETIIKVMETGSCSRPDILEALKKTFPDKPEKVLKNTMGALVHAIMKRKTESGEWTVDYEQDPNDSRKKKYLVTVNDVSNKDTSEAQAESEEEGPTEQAA